MIKDIKLTPQFKQQTSKAILAIVVFVFTYLFLLLFAAVLTAITVYAGLALVINRPSLVTILLGVGLVSMGLLILFFLLKFMFKRHTVDRSHLIEIKRKDEPLLFELIDELVKKVGTHFPKKVYLSAGVNASVFYDSSFWSMFLPIKKNLNIGVGLVNTVSREELKAILAHEFGHFSQETMKIGSYVHNVNHILYNMLYDNEGYSKLIDKWASINNMLAVFVGISVYVISGMQWILLKVYQLVNKRYLALSREMEFHADEIAAHITGYEPLAESLSRLDLADQAYNSVLRYYNNKVSFNIKSPNVYKEQLFIVNFLAQENDIPLKNQLPLVPINELSRFNKSKLNIEDQWASHPSIVDRVERLKATRITANKVDSRSANTYFVDINNTQKLLTTHLFSKVEHLDLMSFNELKQFKDDYISTYSEGTFPKMYNGYYDTHNISDFDYKEVKGNQRIQAFDTLYSDEMVDLVYTKEGLDRDLKVLEDVAFNKQSMIKTFDYDGQKYTRKQAPQLIKELKSQRNRLLFRINDNDIAIYRFFKHLAEEQGEEKKLIKYYKRFLKFDEEYIIKFDLHTRLSVGLEFMSETHSYDDIRRFFGELQPLEQELKVFIREFLDKKKFETIITPEMEICFRRYLSKDWIYFLDTKYNDASISVLADTMDSYLYVLNKSYFVFKRDLLLFQEQLLEKMK